ELAHGLGFSTLVDPSTGAEFRGSPDIYERQLLDLTTGLHWNAMSDAQRATSATNAGQVVWDGARATARTAALLDPRRVVHVNTPAGRAGDHASGAIAIGPVPSAPGVTADVALAVPVDACSPLVPMAGHIALIHRGTCAFVNKALAAQTAGAVGVLIVNDRSGPAPDIGGDAPGLVIPVASLSQIDGNAIESQLGGGVNVTIRSDPAHHEGADDQNRMLIYTPGTVEVGSSVSHWDVSATPNLLMEPVINPDLAGVDLTIDALGDLGWLTGGGGPGAPGVGHVVPNPFT